MNSCSKFLYDWEKKCPLPLNKGPARAVPPTTTGQARGSGLLDIRLDGRARAKPHVLMGPPHLSNGGRTMIRSRPGLGRGARGDMCLPPTPTPPRDMWFFPRPAYNTHGPPPRAPEIGAGRRAGGECMGCGGGWPLTPKIDRATWPFLKIEMQNGA